MDTTAEATAGTVIGEELSFVVRRREVEQLRGRQVGLATTGGVELVADGYARQLYQGEPLRFGPALERWPRITGYIVYLLWGPVYTPFPGVLDVPMGGCAVMGWDEVRPAVPAPDLLAVEVGS